MKEVKRITLLFLAALILSVMGKSAIFAQDWPMFRHDPERTGYSTSNAPNTNDLLWFNEAGGGRNSPSVVNNRVFVGSSEVTSPGSRDIVCLDASDGSLIWSYGGMADDVYSSPAVADGKVFVGDERIGIVCLDASDGSLIWSYRPPGWLPGMNSSPAVADGRVFIGSRNHKLYCFNASDGTVIWSYETGGWIEVSSPAVANGKVFVGSRDGKLYCLNASDGSLIWTYEGVGPYSSPAVADGKVFVSSGDEVVCLDTSDGGLVWMYETEASFQYSSPAVANGKVFVGADDKKVYCLDVSDGSLIWTYETGGWADASPVVADGLLFVRDRSGLYCFGSIVLEVDPASLDFGEMEKGSTKTMSFRAYNAGGATLNGNVSADCPWIAVGPPSFEGNNNTISVTVQTEGLEQCLSPYTGTVTVTSNGGTKTIEVSVVVIPPGLVVCPNPFSFSQHTQLRFWGSSVPYAKIQIFTLGGKLVKTLEEKSGTGMVTWDGRNERGDKVGRGTYVYVMGSFTGKIAIRE